MSFSPAADSWSKNRSYSLTVIFVPCPMLNLAVIEATLWTQLTGIWGIRRFVERAHSQGKRVLFWTLNDNAEMAACLATGADGFFTDDVPLGRAALCAAGLLPPPPDLLGAQLT